MNLQQHSKLKMIQKQKQVLSHKMIQMIKIFNKSYTDLLADINQECKENVVLEIERDDQLLSNSTSISKSQNTDSFSDISDYAVDHSGKTLHDFLQKQLNLLHLDEKGKKIALLFST